MLHAIKQSGWRWLWVSALVIALDRFTKLWVISHLTPFEPLNIFPFFNLTLAYNTGAAFSFLQHASGWQNYLFGFLAAMVTIVIFIWLGRISFRERLLSISLCLIMAGALGNAWDRVRYGYVIDYLSFYVNDWHFAIFNVADSAICVGAFFMIYLWVLKR